MQMVTGVEYWNLHRWQVEITQVKACTLITVQNNPYAGFPYPEMYYRNLTELYIFGCLAQEVEHVNMFSGCHQRHTPECGAFFKVKTAPSVVYIDELSEKSATSVPA